MSVCASLGGKPQDVGVCWVRNGLSDGRSGFLLRTRENALGSFPRKLVFVKEVMPMLHTSRLVRLRAAEGLAHSALTAR